MPRSTSKTARKPTPATDAFIEKVYDDYYGDDLPSWVNRAKFRKEITRDIRETLTHQVHFDHSHFTPYGDIVFPLYAGWVDTGASDIMNYIDGQEEAQIAIPDEVREELRKSKK